jgi:Tol biopolymer transport system component
LPGTLPGDVLLLALLASPPERVYVESPETWFEEVASSARIAPDGRSALYGSRGRVKLVDLVTGREDSKGLAGLDAVADARFLPRGEIALQGRRGDERGWFVPEKGGRRLSPLPEDASPQWSPDGSAAAFYRRGNPEAGLFLGDPARPEPRLSGQRVTGVAWAPDGQSVYAVVCEESGASSVLRVPRGKGDVATVAKDLDAPPRESPIAVSADGARIYIALASASRPDNEARHRPSIRRDLDIYEIATATGARRAVVERPDDDFAPAVVGDTLYWTRAEVREAVVVVPAAGGESRDVVPDAEGPTWRGDGRQIGFTFGGWRIADWALNLDGGVVDFDPATMAASARRPIVTGYHEDFGPAWSPDGRWIAYHSHRPPTPVVHYGGAGSTDDIYLRLAQGGPEIRLTRTGWECGTPDWSPDGRRLVFTGWEKGGEPGRSFAWIQALDPESGEPGALTKLPLPSGIPGAEWASWSPRGDEIALEVAVSPARHALWVVKADGSAGRKRVEYNMKTYGGLDWTPDGKSLVYAALAGGRMQIFAVGADEGSPRQLTRDASHLFQPQASPDGRLVACTRLRERKEIWKLVLH